MVAAASCIRRVGLCRSHRSRRSEAMRAAGGHQLPDRQNLPRLRNRPSVTSGFSGLRSPPRPTACSGRSVRRLTTGVGTARVPAETPGAETPGAKRRGLGGRSGIAVHREGPRRRETQRLRGRVGRRLCRGPRSAPLPFRSIRVRSIPFRSIREGFELSDRIPNAVQTAVPFCLNPRRPLADWQSASGLADTGTQPPGPQSRGFPCEWRERVARTSRANR